MNMFRRGYYANHHFTLILPDSALEVDGTHGVQNNVRWNDNIKRVEIISKPVSDSARKSCYVYVLSLSLSDIVTLIKVGARAVSTDDASDFHESLSKHWTEIVRLLSCASGYAPIRISDETQKRATRPADPAA